MRTYIAGLYRAAITTTSPLIAYSYGGRIEDTFHYHQAMPRLYGNDKRVRKLTGLELDAEMAGRRTDEQLKLRCAGQIKHLRPDVCQVHYLRGNLSRLHDLGKLDLEELRRLVTRVNPEWLPAFRGTPRRQCSDSNRSTDACRQTRTV